MSFFRRVEKKIPRNWVTGYYINNFDKVFSNPTIKDFILNNKKHIPSEEAENNSALPKNSTNLNSNDSNQITPPRNQLHVVVDKKHKSILQFIIKETCFFTISTILLAVILTGFLYSSN